MTELRPREGKPEIHCCSQEAYISERGYGVSLPEQPPWGGPPPGLSWSEKATQGGPSKKSHGEWAVGSGEG